MKEKEGGGGEGTGLLAPGRLDDLCIPLCDVSALFSPVACLVMRGCFSRGWTGGRSARGGGMCTAGSPVDFQGGTAPTLFGLIPSIPPSRSHPAVVGHDVGKKESRVPRMYLFMHAHGTSRSAWGPRAGRDGQMASRPSHSTSRIPQRAQPVVCGTNSQPRATNQPIGGRVPLGPRRPCT